MLLIEGDNLEESKRLLNIIKNNEDKETIMNYYDKVISCFKLRLIEEKKNKR